MNLRTPFPYRKSDINRYLILYIGCKNIKLNPKTLKYIRYFISGDLGTDLFIEKADGIKAIRFGVKILCSALECLDDIGKLCIDFIVCKLAGTCCSMSASAVLKAEVSDVNG